MVTVCISTAHAPQGYISHMTCMCIYRMYTLQGRGGGKGCWALPPTGASLLKLLVPRLAFPGRL